MTSKFLQVIERVGEDIVKTVEFPFTEGGKLVALIQTAETDGPALATAFDGLIAAGATVGGDVVLEIGADGTNLPEYLTVAKDAISFGKYFKGTFLPQLEKMFADAKIDVAPPSAPGTTAAAPAAAPAPAAAANPGAPE